MGRRTVGRVAVLASLIGGSLCGSLAAQQRDWGLHRVDASREELQTVLSRFEAAAQSRAYSRELRELAREQAAAVRTRLSEGDLRVGDRVYLEVEGEPTLTDTFLVDRNRTIALPDFGEVALRGLLRSELESHLKEQLSRFINVPVVRARTFIRVTATGEIGSPGFYTFPAELSLSETLMRLGGPTGDADLSRLRVQRGNERIWEGEQLQEALRQGLTLGELEMRTGDQIVVPARSSFAIGEFARTVVVIPTLVFALTRLF